jgi:hypothetical protein
MCLSERTTQDALNSFHHVGDSGPSKSRLYELFYAYDKGMVTIEMHTHEAALELARHINCKPLLTSACWATKADFGAKWVKQWVQHFGKPVVDPSRRAVHLVLSRDAFFFDTMRAFCQWLGEPAMHSHEKYHKNLEAIVFVPVDEIWDFLAKMDPRKVPKKTNIYVRVEGCVVEADGVQLKHMDTFLGDLPYISLKTTNVRDIEKYQGIEAARQSLFEQASALSMFAGDAPRHLSLLCDAMCASGLMQAVKFTGIGRLTTSTLGKSVFQAPVPTFVNAAVTNRIEQFDNVSACLITGERARVGTGTRFTLIMNDGLTPKGEWKNPLQAQSWYQPL